MFLVGFACGLAAAIAFTLIVGAVWVARQGDPFDDGEDEHAKTGGIGATHFGSVSK